MIKFLIIICLIIKTHSWTWEDYPSPRGPAYWKCGVSRPTYVCDPDGMLTDEQRKEIVESVEDFKEKTKRPNSIYSCWREGLRLVVALAKVKIGHGDNSSETTNLCMNDRKWTSSNSTSCESTVHGIELNTDGFRYCNWTRWLMFLDKEELKNLGIAWKHELNNKNYFDGLKSYIDSLGMLYIDRFAIFDKIDSSNKDNITLLQVRLSLQDTNKKLSELQQIQGKMFIGKNITTNS